MNLETINSIAQIVAAIGVIASLFYLAAQIRQNTKSQRSVVVDSLTSSLITLLEPQAHPQVMRSFAAAVEDWHGANEEDRMRAIALLFTTFKLFENAWFQQRGHAGSGANGKDGTATFASIIIGPAFKPGGRIDERCSRQAFANMWKPPSL